MRRISRALQLERLLLGTCLAFAPIPANANVIFEDFRIVQFGGAGIAVELDPRTDIFFVGGSLTAFFDPATRSVTFDSNSSPASFVQLVRALTDERGAIVSLSFSFRDVLTGGLFGSGGFISGY